MNRNCIYFQIILGFILFVVNGVSAQTIAERLGYKSMDRLLIVNADDFGMCHAANAATTALLSDNVITSATAMVPCPWFKEATDLCKRHAELSVGIHLTLTSEWETYKWGPVSSRNKVPSLITDEGFFPRASRTVEQNAKHGEVRLELETQIERAIQMGINPSHLDSHMWSVYGLRTGRDFLSIVFDLCLKYRLPFRLPTNIPEKVRTNLSSGIVELLKIRARQALDKGIMLIDYMQSTEMQSTYETFRDKVVQQIKALKPGLTELYIHPALPTDEMKAISSNWRHRDFEARVFRDALVQQVLKEEDIILINWLDLREHQRKMVSMDSDRKLRGKVNKIKGGIVGSYGVPTNEDERL